MLPSAEQLEAAAHIPLAIFALLVMSVHMVMILKLFTDLRRELHQMSVHLARALMRFDDWLNSQKR